LQRCPDLQERLRPQARAWTIERFSPQARLDDFLNLYRHSVRR